MICLIMVVFLELFILIIVIVLVWDLKYLFFGLILGCLFL